MQLELVEGGLDVLGRPPSTEPEAKVSNHPGGDLAGEGSQSHQLQRWDPQKHICHRDHYPQGESTADPSEQETCEYRYEKEGGGHLDQIDTAGYRHQPN
ncbi:MAG TPA: hypothetical protein VJ815_00410 [Acidimicrobiia bacterium]|nr:hypothetical protein [Acidimicrobiia bacterium]